MKHPCPTTLGFWEGPHPGSQSLARHPFLPLHLWPCVLVILQMEKLGVELWVVAECRKGETWGQRDSRQQEPWVWATGLAKASTIPSQDMRVLGRSDRSLAVEQMIPYVKYAGWDRLSQEGRAWQAALHVASATHSLCNPLGSLRTAARGH